MRASSIILGATAFASSAFARYHHHACMNTAEAQQVATNFGNLISNYSKHLANAALAPNFMDYSDSVIELIDSGCTAPVAQGSATFSTRAAFEAGQGSQPDIPFNQLNLWHNCDTVFIRWSTPVASGAPETVTGIIVAEVEQGRRGHHYPWVIKTVYSEFNSGAWLVDLGVFVPNCTTTA